MVFVLMHRVMKNMAPGLEDHSKYLIYEIAVESLFFVRIARWRRRLKRPLFK